MFLRKYAVLAVLALLFVVSSITYAQTIDTPGHGIVKGGPDAFFVTSDTGRTQIDLYGKTVAVTNDCVVWRADEGNGTRGISPSAPQYYNGAYPSILIGGQAYNEAYADHSSGAHGLLQGGNDARGYYPVSFKLYGAGWGTMILNVWNGAGYPITANWEMKAGDSLNCWLPSSETSSWSLTSTAPVPEPGSLMALGSGLLGLGGLALRRRK